MPAILLLAWALVLGLSRAQSSVENGALVRAETMRNAADNRLAIDLGALRTFATSSSLGTRDWDAARARAATVVGVNPGWKAVVVVRRSTGEVVMRTNPETEPAPAVSGAAAFDVVRDGPACPCVVLRERIASLPDHDLVALVDPAMFQPAALAAADDGRVAALVDREGRFVARSLDYPARVGLPATQYVRGAVRKGGEGVYRGRTYEGLENYTAYVTSDISNWSAHVAVNRQLIDSPRFWLFIVLVGGSLLALMAAGGVLTYGLIDLSARRRAEAQMLRLQKSEAIGQFASGVAHDFNNLLMVIIGNLERISADPKASRDIAGRADMALEAARRGSRLSTQLLGFARDGHAEAGAVDVVELLDDLSELIRQSVGAGVAVTIRADPHARMVLADQDQLELAMLNLALNARDAMKGQGALTVETAARGKWVEIAVEDTGPGVDGSARERLFEPFFTTKPEGEGTGLGLAQVLDMATRAGGDVRLEETPHGGARFVIVLPVARPGQMASAVTD